MRAAVLVLAAVAGCGGGELDARRATSAPPSTVVTSGETQVTFDVAAGTFDVARGGVPVLLRATADALVRGPDGATREVSLSGCPGATLSAGELACARDGVALRLRVTALGDGALALSLALTNTSSDPLRIDRVSPLFASSATGGGLALGARASRHRVLENGRWGAFDQTAQLEQGDARAWPLGQALGLPYRGASVSNWSHAVVDLDDPSRSLVAGYLSFERALPALGVAYEGDAPALPDGRERFDTYAADEVMAFTGREVAAGETLDAEPLYLEPLPADPLAALERYATELARHQGITPWTKRDGGRAVPNGWNSWTGGSSTGGYGQDVDEALILANMEVQRRELLAFGDTYFQLDDGWQAETGDWTFRADKFPSGGAALAARFRDAGFAPGLWIAPFWAKPQSALALAHPDWLQPLEENLAATAAGKDRETLDLSNPAVREHVRAVAAGLRADGWAWIKTDFTYLAALGQPRFDRGRTNVENLRAGYRAVREGVGPETFVLGIGLLGPNVGYADGMRLTLDNAPAWEEATAAPTVESSRAIKGTVRTGSRRWFYQDRVWLNHDDLVFFRAHSDPKVPPLSLEEARAFATWVGMMGGSVELGDKLLELTPPQLDVVRRLMPAYPAGSRPVDVLTRDYPERFVQEVDAEAGRWRNVTVCNWGKNRDLSVEPPAPMEERTRRYRVDCDGDCVVYAFWSGAYLGRAQGGLEVDVAPRRCEVFAARPAAPHPQVLGTNRHVTQGANDLGATTWDATTRTLSGVVVGAAGTETVPFAHELAVRAPAGFTLDAAVVDGVATPQVSQDGEVVKLGFALRPEQTGKRVAFSVRFR